MGASVKLLPSSRFCAPHHETKNGKIIWISTSGRLCCEHGEYISQIRDWIRDERKAIESGITPATRQHAVCNCSDLSEYGKFPKKAETPPPAPPSVYDFLEQGSTAEHVEVPDAGKLYRVPHMDGPTYMREDGTMVCVHGHARKSVFVQSKTQAKKCSCKFGPMAPRKDRFCGVKLGRVAKWKPRTVPLFELLEFNQELNQL